MPTKHHALRSALLAALLTAVGAAEAPSAPPEPNQQTFEAIRKCIVKSPAPWPDEWKREYVETIRSAVNLYQDGSHYASRLDILCRGFPLYWENLAKANERSLFEVHRCRTRWYVEHLMGAEFPSDEERRRLRDQLTEIWDYASDSLLKQFPFLDPNTVRKATADELSTCYRRINAPLMPVYLRPMSEEQVERIKQQWDKLRYARVDIWRRLSGRSPTLRSKL